MADYIYVKETGVIIPDTARVQPQVEGEYKNAFGQDLVVRPTTPQGMLITSDTLARMALIRNNAALANQINPNKAGGIFLAAICALTGLEIVGGSFTSVVVNLAGIPNTFIPDYIIGKDTILGNLFLIAGATQLGPTGEATATFLSINPGPIVVAANTLTVIVEGILGLETINNPAPGIPGTDVPSDVEVRATRRKSLALQASSLAFAVMSQLTVTPGVRSKSFRENKSDSTLVIDGITMVPHSLYACVDGGTNLDVATAIQGKKSGGCNYNRDAGIGVTVNVTDPNSLQVTAVSFDRPDLIGILIKATVSIKDAIGDPISLIKQAILDYAQGLMDGEDGFAVGVPVSCFELSGAIAQRVPSLFIKKVETSLQSPVSYSTNEIPIALFEKAYTLEDYITVVVV